MAKTLLRAAVAGVASLAVAGPAYAADSPEGSFKSSVSGVYSGFGSRTWTDNNSNNADNYAQIYSCNRGASIALYRNRQFPIPDQVVGDEKSTCDNKVFYRAGTRGDIHFTVKKTEKSGSLYGSVQVSY